MIFYSRTPNMADPHPLEGALLSGVIYIFAEPAQDTVSRVIWFLDGDSVRENDLAAPYTMHPNSGQLAGATDLNDLEEGPHAVCIVVEGAPGTAPVTEIASFGSTHTDEPPPPSGGRGPSLASRAPFTPPYTTPADFHVTGLLSLNAALAVATPGDVIEVTADIPSSVPGAGGAVLRERGGELEQNVLVRPPIGRRLKFTPTFANNASFITVAGFTSTCWFKPGAGGWLTRSGLWRCTSGNSFMGFYGRTESCFLVDCVTKEVQTGSDPVQVKADVGDVVKPLIANCWFAGARREGTSHTDVIQFVGYGGYGELDPTVRGVVSGPSASGVIQHSEIKGLFTIDNCWLGAADGRTINGGSARYPASLLMRDTDLNGGAIFKNDLGIDWRVLGVVDCNAAGEINVNDINYPKGTAVGSMPALPSAPWGDEVPL